MSAASSSFDLITRTSFETLRISDVVLPDGSPLYLTKASIIFGENRTTNFHLVNLWTHCPTDVHNDLVELGARVSCIFDGRATRNIKAKTISIDKFIVHEISPHVRCKYHALSSFTEMIDEFKANLLVRTTAVSASSGRAYSGQTDVLVVHLTAAHFLEQCDINALSCFYRSNAPAESKLLIIAVVSGENAMYQHACSLSDDGPCLILPILCAPQGVSLVTLAQWLRFADACIFQSCELPKENVKLVFTAEHVQLPPLLYYCGNSADSSEGKYLGKANAPAYMPSRVSNMFSEHEFLICSATPIASEDIYFSFHENHALEITKIHIAAASSAPEPRLIKLAQVANNFPYWKQWISGALITWITTVLPTNIDLIAPARALRRQIAILRTSTRGDQLLSSVAAMECALEQLDSELAAQGYTAASKINLGKLYATLLENRYMEVTTFIEGNADLQEHASKASYNGINTYLYSIYAPGLVGNHSFTKSPAVPVLPRSTSKAANYSE
jgi:hypothetical protein